MPPKTFYILKKFSVYDENCLSHKLMQIISDKWVILIINTLARKAFRFNELKREIGGISQKMLTHTIFFRVEMTTVCFYGK